MLIIVVFGYRPKKYSEKMKAEASILQRIGELQKEGMWYDKRLPKVKEPDRRKTHWDYVLEEVMWMHMDFQQERKWKQAAARKVCCTLTAINENILK